MIYVRMYDETGCTAAERSQRETELAGRLLLYAVRREFGFAPDTARIAKGRHGKPYFQGLPVSYNISHCAGAVCCAVGRKELGIDIEPAGRQTLSAVSRVCSENEQADIRRAADPGSRFMQYWTLKESYVKYLGEGLSFGLQNAVFAWHGGVPVLAGSPLPFQQEYLGGSGAGFWLSACGEELPMTVQIITEEDEMSV